MQELTYLLKNLISYQSSKVTYRKFNKKTAKLNWVTKLNEHLTKKIIDKHLNGEITAGYFLKPFVNFFVLDLDLRKQTNVTALKKVYKQICNKFVKPSLVFQSSKSKGLHLYWFAEKNYHFSELRKAGKFVVSNLTAVKGVNIDVFPSTNNKMCLRFPYAMAEGGYALHRDTLRPIGKVNLTNYIKTALDDRTLYNNLDKLFQQVSLQTVLKTIKKNPLRKRTSYYEQGERNSAMWRDFIYLRKQQQTRQNIEFYFLTKCEKSLQFTFCSRDIITNKNKLNKYVANWLNSAYDYLQTCPNFYDKNKFRIVVKPAKESKLVIKKSRLIFYLTGVSHFSKIIIKRLEQFIKKITMYFLTGNSKISDKLFQSWYSCFAVYKFKKVLYENNIITQTLKGFRFKKTCVTSKYKLNSVILKAYLTINLPTYEYSLNSLSSTKIS